MPADMTSQRLPAVTQQPVQHSNPSEPSRPNETRFYAQTNRQPLQRNSPIVPVTNQASFSSLHSRESADQQIEETTSKRRKSIRDCGPTIGGPVSLRRTTIHSHSNSQNKSETPFPNVIGSHTPPESSEFLPAINFDDFHNSISSKEPSLSHFPMPGQLVAGIGSAPSPPKSTTRWSTTTSSVSGPKPARTNTLNRRQSNAQKPDLEGVGTGISVGGVHNSTGPTPGPVTTRTRRQSHATPPVSSTAGPRQPRKSIGPGASVTSQANGDDGPPRRRQSFAKRNATGEIRVNTNVTRGSHQPTEQSSGPSFLNTTRSQKAKSLQPVSRGNRENQITPGGSDHSRSSSNTAIQTPGKGTMTLNTTPSSKRSSMMPHHPTGLGARTISPTDARRMKRMSLVPNPPPIPQRSPTQLELNSPRPRSSAPSPSMIPRKSVTPSSARTTPDPHRKSYSSGVSLSSNTTYNSARNSSGSLQGRLSQTISTSRLPTPKPRTEHSNQEEEEVPPVPAIPKAYESPKNEAHLPQTFTPRQISMPFELEARRQAPKDAASATEVEAPSTPAHQTFLGDAMMQHDNRAFSSEFKPRATVTHGKRSLQPLKLPPLNLMPLSAPVASKINALRDKEPKDFTPNRSTTPPPPRQTVAKTPSTPMTASKTSFSHAPQEHTPMPAHTSRSNSSQFILPYQTGYRSQNSSSALDFMGLSSNRTISPYISSSLPRGTDEMNSMRDKVASKPSTNKLTGPRPQTQFSTISASESLNFKYEPDTIEPNPSPTVVPPSPQRKISLDQTRQTGCNDTGTADNVKFENMPPPKLPASASVNNLSRTSPASNTNFAPAKRKQSISNVVASISSRRNKSITGEPGPTVVTQSSTEIVDEAQPNKSSSSSILNPVQRLLGGPRPPPAPVSTKPRVEEGELDRDDLIAEEEMRKLGSKRKDFESAARELDELRRRAGPKERASPAQALKIASLNIFERGEIIDYKDIYFCGTHKAKKHVGDLNAQTANFGYDDERGDYNIVIGDHIAYRYEVVDVLGKGSFGQVVRCVDHKTGTLVAVKIIRNKKRFHQQALVEVNILQKLKEWDPQNRHSVVNFTQSFYFRGHLCISTELLGINLYEFIKAHDFRGFSLKIIRRFTKQMLMSLVLLQNHKVVHCDMKPENVLLVHPLRGDIKVIDFGSSCFENEKVYTYIQSRFYRSPEVILGMSYGMPIDMWSLGCILAELYTGYPLFPGENEQEQLACIMEIFGPPEKHLIEKSTRKKLFFDSSGKPRLTVSSKGRRRKPSSTDLRQALKCDNPAFLDFIARCLRWDPARRMTPRDAMQHEFITGIRAPPRSTRSLHHSHSQSPVKRFASTSATLNGRPLPNPPSTASSSDGTRLRDSSTNSPVKHGLPKRHSTFHHTSTTTTANPGATPKRASNIPPSGGSALPRVTPRNASGKPDLAAAAATTSLKTKV
ncbi:CMGC/DYRK/DYRK2 protein kinase [Trichophyton rubrum D6]|uniref:dual-specificity kinase n=2 Tax=Trichophyton rubrum TaxID=5551 RepID=A0A178EU59_TRIRU|nr:CMGC/DYRK/DYRK2 protein kinase [Trichophyton rubrum MR850]EZF37707.1 CMGC/DYRK/DYRK2 protein kinase [Trichophyton rubrum CBS 100081]EZF48387.1 CMGC/DYRK/DYRK2 protein kinase [Trichophyton rubrum CBS 288.86]EZF58978.1 CMGC/DYRK/DYRK2 protein kinase [Trichophyton rubrum CBS 289.86]EZF80265.1 CMGC/DYRK/DYRK2 protein kinase [Trichophyton rubrum MR1448]EZF90926.1 CMGC/DYRK/DYRK2 protein kinase [Trichophyton rubrum MR1459]EZG12492.1 CMGC/DYRK/DYRK2 protein kinase [Trichophyton rubrum CBS 202.88]